MWTIGLPPGAILRAVCSGQHVPRPGGLPQLPDGGTRGTLKDQNEVTGAACKQEDRAGDGRKLTALNGSHLTAGAEHKEVTSSDGRPGWRCARGGVGAENRPRCREAAGQGRAGAELRWPMWWLLSACAAREGRGPWRQVSAARAGGWALRGRGAGNGRPPHLAPKGAANLNVAGHLRPERKEP